MGLLQFLFSWSMIHEAHKLVDHSKVFVVLLPVVVAVLLTGIAIPNYSITINSHLPLAGSNSKNTQTQGTHNTFSRQCGDMN